MPTREAKDSEHPDPTGGGKDSVCTVKQGIYIYPRKHKRPPSGRQAKVVCKTMGTTGRSPISSRHPQTGLSPTIQGSSQAVQNTLHSQRIQRNQQRQCLVEFYTRPPGQKRHRGSKQTRQSRILQLTVLSSQTREQMETRDRPQLPKPISNGLKIQDANPRINPHIAQPRGMGHIDRSLRRIPSHSHSPTIKKVPQVPPQGNLISVHQPALWSGHSPSGLHLANEGSKAPSSKAGHSSTSVLRRLADKGLFPGRSSETHRQASLPDTKPRVYSKPTKVRTQPPAEVRLHRLPFFVGPRSCQTHKRQMEQDPNFIQQNFQEICPQCTNSYVHHWITGVHRENSKIGQDTHETFPMAPQDPLEIPNASEFSNSLDSENETTRNMVAKPPKCSKWRILTPKRSRHFNLYRRIKRRLERTLKSRLRRRHMVSGRKTTTHKCIGTKSSDPSSSTFLTTMQQETGVSSIRQHHSSSPHKQTGGNPLTRTLCPHVEASHMVQQKPDNPQGKTRPRLSQCNYRRPFQEKPNKTHRVVSGTPDFQEDFSTLGTSSDISICHKPEYKTPNLCVPYPEPTGLGSGRSKHILEKHDRLRLSPHSTTTKSGPKVTVPGMQAHPDSPGLANEVVVLGSGGTVSRPPKTTPTNSLATQTTTEQPIPHSPRVPQPPRMVSRSSILQDQGFSAEVADRIAAPQRLSTRAIYASKWAVFERWCIKQQVDFRAPSIKHICDFMCFLFNEKDRRPSTIEGYRTAIADTLGNAPLDISNNAEIARLIASFHRDKPKSTRNLPQWDLSLVLHQLKQPPFEPLGGSNQICHMENSLFTSPSLREKTERNTRLDIGRITVPRQLGPNSTYPLTFLHCQEPISKGRNPSSITSGYSRSQNYTKQQQ